MKRVLRIILAAVLAAGAALLPSDSVYIPEIAEGIYAFVPLSLPESALTKSDDTAAFESPDYGPSQLFRVHHAGGGRYQISGLLGGYLSSGDENAPLYFIGSGKGTAAYWEIIAVPDGGYKLQNPFTKTAVSERDGDPVTAVPDTGDSQRFSLVPEADFREIKDGCYAIWNGDENKPEVMTLNGGELKPGEPDYSPSQLCSISYTGEAEYDIKSLEPDGAAISRMLVKSASGTYNLVNPETNSYEARTFFITGDVDFHARFGLDGQTFALWSPEEFGIKFLTAEEGKVLSKNANFSDSQRFTAQYSGMGKYGFTSAGTGLSLSADTSHNVLLSAAADDFSLWTVKKLENGEHKIVNAATSEALRLGEAGDDGNAALITGAFSSLPSQVFCLLSDENYAFSGNGFKKLNDRWYYFRQSELCTGWRKVSERWYYLSETEKPVGMMQTGNLNFAGRTYEFTPAGRLISDYDIKFEGEKSAYQASVDMYKQSFERLPWWLKRSVDKVTFLSRSDYDALYGYHMAATVFNKQHRPKYDIHINYGKLPSSDEGQFGFYSIAVHESAHALDTNRRLYSGSEKWKEITEKYGRKIYSPEPDKNYEVFAAAVAWYLTDPQKLIGISQAAYDYIKEVEQKQVM